MSMLPRPQRVLVVDDEPDIRQLVGFALEEAGYQPAFAESGWRAVEAVQTQPPDLVLLDLVMLEGDGWFALECLKQMPPTPPVVVMSGRGDARAVSRAIREGAAGYLFKPFRIADLVTVCDRVLRTSIEAERRREPRHILAVDLDQRGFDRPHPGVMLDVSTTGARLDLDQPLDPGQPLNFSVPIPVGGAPSLSLTGRVQWRWDDEPRFVHGLVFEGLSAETERQLRELLSTAP